MQKEIIINALDNQNRIAIAEEGRLAELFIESAERERMVGDIYLGTVAKVMPGIQASFIDIGLDQDAFLHFSDVGDNFREFSAFTGEEDEYDREGEEQETQPKEKKRRRRPVAR